MRFRTEDLLTLRDGEPMDAPTKARLDADPAAGCAVGELELRRRALASLPELRPGPDVVDRVLAAMRDAADARSIRRKRRGVALAAAAGLAAVALLVLTRVPTSVPSPGETASATSSRDELNQLLVESALLERALSALPGQRAIVNVGTAGTIAGLEDQVAFIDAQLLRVADTETRNGDANGSADSGDDYRAALWRERVDVMNALVQVRYAQLVSY